MKPIIVGIAGPKRAGKNTTSRILRACLAEFDQETLVGETAFADPMYRMLEAFLDPETVSRLRDSDDKDTEIIEPFGCTLRHMAQTLGTEWGRNLIHPDAWVLAMERQVNMAAGRLDSDLPAIVLVPDVRFINEAEYVRNNGFLLHIQQSFRIDWADSHTSETPLEVEDTDTVIQNTGTLEQFEAKVYEYGRSTFLQDIAAAIRASGGDGRLLDDAP